MQYIIYSIVCTVNNKRYIGVTEQSLSKRWYQHQYLARSGKGSHLHNAIRKYGADAFEVQQLFVGFEDRDQIERLFIEQYNTYHTGYNSTLGGEDFTSSEYQRELQKRRVKDGTHPFIGGNLQKQVSKARWDNDTNPIKGLNAIRVCNGTHNFLGKNNPQKRISALNQHHNQTKPWNNTKSTAESYKAWSIADKMYQWFKDNHHKQRGGSYKAMAAAFGITCSLQKMYYEYFKKGWIPLDDPSWVSTFSVLEDYSSSSKYPTSSHTS